MVAANPSLSDGQLVSHFDLFGLSPSVDLDVAKLEASHRTLSFQTHPDRLVDADPHARRLAAQKAAVLNEAVKVLRDPFRRALYLLELKGVKLEGESGAAEVKMPQGFLEQILEVREQLEEAKANRNLETAQAMAAQIRAARARSLASGQEALRGNDLTAATLALSQVRYYTRFLEEVDALEEELLS